MEWQAKLGGEWFDSADGNYRIVRRPGRGKNHKQWRLISFIHETETGDLRTWDFASLDEAKEYTELI